MKYIEITVVALRAMHLPAFPEYEEGGEFSGSYDDNEIVIRFDDFDKLIDFAEYSIMQFTLICESYTYAELQKRNMATLADYENAGFTIQETK